MSPERSIDPLHRSLLAVPAASPHYFQKAAISSADAVFLDLEDAVTAARREEARSNAVYALDHIEWGGKLVSVRINPLGTRWALDDILAIGRCPRLDAILVPKVEGPGDIVFVHRLLEALEVAQPRVRPIGISVLIESAKGLAHVESIAASSARLESMIFGAGDYSIDLESSSTIFGAPNPDYVIHESGPPAIRHWNDVWHFPLARIANACRAYGIRPIDGPYVAYRDSEGYRAACLRSRALGFEGKLAIHPSQVPVANEAFSPRQEQIAWAREVLQRMKDAEDRGAGALGMNDMLVDAAHVKLATKILRRAGLSEPASGVQQ